MYKKRNRDKIIIHRTEDDKYYASMDYFNSNNGDFWCRIETAHFKTRGGARNKMIKIAERFGVSIYYV